MKKLQKKRRVIPINNVVLIGRLTRDPELKMIPSSGTAVAEFSIAVNRPFAKENDKTKADFINIVVFGKRGENAAKYLEKGRLVGIEGRIQIDVMEKDGKNQYYTKIIASNVEFLEWGEKKDRVPNVGKKVDNSLPDGFQELEDDDDIPF